ncbi:TadE/TadG family type IV pilus assembly protein [Zhongshania aquimaris]|uniref:Pilus assembly protein n=1 Tax=Zhongshania aquimaris TaxID=2857107 RepID=A0ABS6VME2_9GAMM|nr:TadE/TadG family type IV pilus assembly protein [Zhongshania aquimaris]MBW2939483.1 pilus assembly protein [Zhongshania aquimaris]
MVNRNFYRSFLQRQKGAVAIEFVFIFPVLFIICYAIIVYGLAFLLVQNFTYSSEEVLRAALVCEDCETPEDWETEINTIANIRLKKDDADGLLIYSPDSLVWSSDCRDASVPEDGEPALDGIICEVTVSAAPLLDGISMPGFGKLPTLPDQLSGKASLLF